MAQNPADDPNALRDASAPLLRMAAFYLTLPAVADVRDLWAQAGALHARGIPLTRGEARLLRQVAWCMLQVERDAEEGELFRALAQVAALVLAIIEDDELELPDAFAIRSRLGVEALALELKSRREQLDLSVAAAVGLHDIAVARAADLDALEARLPQDPDVAKAIRQGRIHLRQGEELLAQKTDPAKAEAHRGRLAAAYARTAGLLARLVAVPAAAEPRVIRGNIVRRELRHIEVDALGVERVGEAEQARRTRELLAWTEADLGEALTAENRAALAARLKDAATSDHGDEDDDGADWLSTME